MDIPSKKIFQMLISDTVYILSILEFNFFTNIFGGHVLVKLIFLNFQHQI